MRERFPPFPKCQLFSLFCSHGERRIAMVCQDRRASGHHQLRRAKTIRISAAVDKKKKTRLAVIVVTSMSLSVFVLTVMPCCSLRSSPPRTIDISTFCTRVPAPTRVIDGIGMILVDLVEIFRKYQKFLVLCWHSCVAAVEVSSF